MKRLSLDEILNKESFELSEPIYECKKPKVKIIQSDVECQTGKIGYPTVNDAEKAKNLLKKKHKGGKWYKCEFCGQYHLTSIKKKCKGKMKF